MDISEIVIQGIAPHGSIDLKNLKAFNILVGPNNSGKSFTLEAIAKLIDYKSSTHIVRHKRFFSERKTSFNIKGADRVKSSLFTIKLLRPSGGKTK